MDVLSRPLRIDVVSDVICPWCLIGEKRLRDALAKRPDIDAKIVFHPFLLDPGTPAEGADLRERLRAKYRVDPEKMFARVEQAARESGIPLDFAKVRRTPNTLPAHVLIGHAEERGTQLALVRAIFEAYFLQGKDVGDPDVLAEIASHHGFEVDEARGLATNESERERVRAEAQASAEEGVQGVPFFVLDQRLAFSGAQPIQIFLRAFDQALADKNQAP
ncbi:MAG: DsbA family oxidoreductase [Polyangiales bacterium]